MKLSLGATKQDLEDNNKGNQFFYACLFPGGGGGGGGRISISGRDPK